MMNVHKLNARCLRRSSGASTTGVRTLRRGRGGSAIIEMALLMPWLVFLFVGILDFGFYTYAAICTQSAARAAAVATSQSAKYPNLRHRVLGRVRGIE